MAATKLNVVDKCPWMSEAHALCVVIKMRRADVEVYVPLLLHFGRKTGGERQGEETWAIPR